MDKNSNRGSKMKHGLPKEAYEKIKKVMDDIKQARKEIQYTYSKYEELDDEDPTKLDLGDKLNHMFDEASENYNNIMAMLPVLYMIL